MHTTRRLLALSGGLIVFCIVLGVALLSPDGSRSNISDAVHASPMHAVPWRALYAAMGGDAQVAVRLSPLRGLVQEASTARGRAIIDFHDNRVKVHIQGLPVPTADALYRLLLVHNLPGAGRSAALDMGPGGDAVIDLGVLTRRGTEAYLETRVDRERLRHFPVDLVVVTRASAGVTYASAGVPETVVLGGYTSVVHRLGRQAGLAAMQRRAAASGGWWQRLWPPLVGPSPVAADASTALGAQLQAMALNGRELFFQEAFDGNGRTCATCHRQERHFTIDPALINTLPPTDALFVGCNETPPAGLEDCALLRTRGLILVHADGFGHAAGVPSPTPAFQSGLHLAL